ncbi:hypothetical protein K1719_015036 [Acacia pycnantha]|nr:hypothetical protein K1719_015036 [Acacia pycnantha]
MGESESERAKGERTNGDGKGLGDGDGGGGGREEGSHSMGGQFVFGKGEGNPRTGEQNHERKGDARRPVSISYREKLLSPGGLGFLVSHEEADDIVSGWKGFFAKKRAESEMYEGEDGGLIARGRLQFGFGSQICPWNSAFVESLEIIGNMIGKIIKIDRSTSIYDKGGFARICVEVDLLKPLLPAFTVFGEDKQLVYEGLHLVCFNCGRYGHAQEQCADRIDELHKTPVNVGSEGGPESSSVAENKDGGETEKATGQINVKNMKERVVDVEIRKESQVTEVEATATVAGGRNHLGPQMVFHRNMRRLPPRVAGSKDEAWSEGGGMVF